MYTSRSKSDPNPKGLVFETKQQADDHTNRMNSLKESWPEGWNHVYWKSKPEEWITQEK